jgi:DNA-binding MarR family transcriptional regulator
MYHFFVDKDGTEYALSALSVKILKLLRNNPTGLNQKTIIKELQHPRTTIHDNTDKLIQHNLVRTFSRPINKRGRPEVFFIASIIDEEINYGNREEKN